MSNLKSALERALPIVAAAYGEQFGVNVVLSGDQAYTDGQNIVLPLLDNMSELKNVLFGYLAHEAAHIRDSDFSAILDCDSAIEKSFLNLIEDIRIELQIQEVFPGTRFKLNDMWTYVVEKGMSSPAQPEDNEATQLHQYLLHRLRTEVLKRDASFDLHKASELVVQDTFPKGFFIRLDGLLAKYLPRLTSTSDCLVLAKAIMKALKDAEQEEKQDQDSSQDDLGKDSQGSDLSQDNSSPGDDSSDSDQSSSESTPENNDSTDNQSAQDQSDSSMNNSSQDSSTDDQSGNGASMHEKLINEDQLPEDALEQLRGTLAEKAQDDNDGQHVTLNTSSVGDAQRNDGDAGRLSAGILASSSIRSKLLGLLAAQTRQQQRLHTRGKRVDGKRLTRLVGGDSRVFIQRDDAQKIDTSVHVLLDCSGSMNCIQSIANQATVSLALAISSIPGCDIGTSMFPGNGGDVSPMVHRGQPIRPSLDSFDVRSGGGTPLAQAMLYAARDLAKSRRSRKVLIVITDGDPDNSGAVHYMNSIIKNHVDTYAIGIGSTAVKSYFENWSVINDVSELQRALFQVAGKFLDLN